MIALDERLKKIDKKNTRIRTNNLVISIDEKGKIVKFNEICERTFGYGKRDLINKHLFELLIPPRYIKHWKNILYSVQNNKLTDDFKIPLMTKGGHEIMVSWSCFPIKNTKGVVTDIGLVGKIITSWNDDKEPTLEHSKRDAGLSKDYMDSYKTIKNLEKKIIELETENKKLYDELKSVTEDWDEASNEESGEKHGAILNRGLYSFSEVFGGKKKKQELENIIHELDEREKYLTDFEAKLVGEKKAINEKIQVLCVWREKLESVESEIENRRVELDKKESLPVIQTPAQVAVVELDENKILVEHLDVLEGIPECAAVIQRGILKQVNAPFANLIGYNTNEIVDKSLFDFIVLEGFAEVEKYYLNRLKGEDVNSYATVLLTKDNNKINVEINSKSTFFKGEKAEIVTFKILNNEIKK